MIDTYVVKKMSTMDYYRVFQEVQSAKQLARTHMKTQISTHERNKHEVSKSETSNVMAPRKWGSNLDVKA